MSHIFISYTHADKTHLDKLVAWLTENGFAQHELWYDQNIAGGNNWRDEITSALNEAYCLVVLVTESSVKSQYCTYEWAYAMGQGIPLVPLVFGELSIADVPTPLTSKQFVNCAELIPAYLKEQISGLRSVPPQVAAINSRIYEAIYDTHRRFFILGWLGDQIGSTSDSEETMMIDFIEDAEKAHQTLQALMMDKAFAFSGKQYRLCWRLIDFLGEFSRLRYNVDGYLQDHLFPRFEDSWLPAFEYFEGDREWSRSTRRFFEWDLNDVRNRMEVFAEIMRVFPYLSVPEANVLVYNLQATQADKKGNTAPDTDAWPGNLEPGM